LIKFKKDIDFLVKDAFDGNIIFEDIKNKSFTFFMNKDIYPVKLSEYCDIQFKSGLRNKNESQIEDDLNDIINLFKCLNNRLKFQLDFTSKLTDRLISNSTVSIVAEKNFIAKQKAEAGVAYVTKMSAMIQDLDNSKKELDKFRMGAQHRGKPFGIEMNVTILGNSSWDIDKSKTEKLMIPNIFDKLIEDYTSFYLRDRSMYRLNFVLGLVIILYLSLG
jgi:hypothetical protein